MILVDEDKLRTLLLKTYYFGLSGGDGDHGPDKFLDGIIELCKKIDTTQKTT